MNQEKVKCCKKCKGTGIVQNTGEHYDSCIDFNCICHNPMQEPTNKEFPRGKENYCPRCYFEDEMTVLRRDCKHNKDQEPTKGCQHEWQGWSDYSTDCKKCGKVLVKPTQEPTKERIESVDETRLRYQVYDIIVRGLVKDSELSKEGFTELLNFISQLLARQKEEIVEKLKHIAMVDNGKEPKYFVSDVLKILD